MYRPVAEIFASYWRAYGGFAALRRSPYLHLAVVVLAFTAHYWSSKDWWSQVLSVIPNLLGFTLGGFAVFLGFGDEKFRGLLAEPDEDTPGEPTLYMKLCATFVHFILIQSLALLAAVLANGLDFYYAPITGVLMPVLPHMRALGGALGYGLFLYALSSVMAATMHVFRIAIFYEQHQRVQAQIEADRAARAAQDTSATRH